MVNIFKPKSLQLVVKRAGGDLSRRLSILYYEEDIHAAEPSSILC